MKRVEPLVAILAMAILSVGTPMSAAASPMYVPCDPGNVTYQGHVYDQANAALQGVVVYLKTPASFEQHEGTARSDSAGYWSLSLANCPYNGKFYWQSNSNGPLLKSVSYIPATTSYVLNLWRAAQNVPIAYEFPNTPNVRVRWETGSSVKVSVDAKFDAGFQVGFLGANFALQVGTDITVENSFSVTATQPTTIVWPTGTVYKIVDTSGKSLIYVQQYSSANYGTLPATELLDINTVETRQVNDGEYPFVCAAPGVIDQTYVSRLETTETTDTEFSLTVNVGGVQATLTVHMGVASGSYREVTTLINNPDTYSKCYVVYDDALNVHVYLHNNGACPY